MKKLLIMAFVLRILLIPIAFHGDLYNNSSWGKAGFERGLVNLYEGKNWDYSAPNQPPLYILLFVLVYTIYHTISNISFFLNDKVGIFPSSFIWFWKDHGLIYLLKLPSIFADLGIGFFVFNFFKDRKKIKTGLILACVWLFNPLTWYNSAVWGQTDPIVNFLGLVAILYLLKKDLVKFSIFITLSILFKPSLTIFAPVLLFVAVMQKHKLSIWLKSFTLSLISCILISIWFHPYIDLPIWLINLYQNRILSGEIGDLSANAFNFWWLVDHGKTLDSKIFFGITARVWGYILALGGISVIILSLKKNLSEKKILFALALSALLTFLFMTRIHERYLYPFFPVATILLAFIPQILIPYMILSIIHLLNLYNLFWAPGFLLLENIYKLPWFIPTLATVNILIFFVLLIQFFKNSKN